LEIGHEVSYSPLTPIADENERVELEFLRQKVPQLEKNLNEGSSQNIPEFQEHFVRLDPPIEVS
jgi:hypothetical protein